MLRCGPHTFPLDRPLVLGVVNVTPDSFSDGGRFAGAAAAIEHALALAAEGADLVDVGGESTRPGARAVPAEEEIRRIAPVVAALAERTIAVSVDTRNPEVMRWAVGAGAAMVNDVNGFRAPGAIEAVAGSSVGVCAMHMQGTPETMQRNPSYDDVVVEVASFLRERATALEAAGVAPGRIVLDPGFGFGKNRGHNVALFRALPALASIGYPILAGLSRKRLIGDITGRDVHDRLAGSVAAAVLAVQNGASLVRVHDVKETVDALKVWMALGTREFETPQKEIP